MTTFSALTPDIDAVCRTQFGRGVASCAPIGTGRNSRVFRVDLFPDGREAQTVVFKFYRRDPGDTRDRLAVEFEALRFLWENGIRTIARPMAADRERYCGVYEYIVGTPIAAVSQPDVDAAVDFLASLKLLRDRPGSACLPVASEAQFSLAGIASAVESRVVRLRQSPRQGDGVALHEWIDDVLEPLTREVDAWSRSEAARSKIPYDAELDALERILSPSDFGFHNAVRRPDGTLGFVDFEYFGWDDPAKTAADFVLHPGMALAEPLRRRYMSAFLAAFKDNVNLPSRARIVYPMFGIKWCLIILNDFLPGRAATVAPDELSTVRRNQLAKADAFAARIKREYQLNPYIL
jgi:Phosphotransferase enzyme family